MKKDADLIIVGAGPAGLTAARVAVEKGFKVILIEMKKDIPRITRTCAQIFYLEHIGGGQTYIKPVKVEIESGKKSKMVFPDLNFSIEYSGLLRACYDWRNLSPDGTCVFTTRNKLWGFVFNKEILLKDLLEVTENLGVTILRGTRGINAQNINGGVQVEIKETCAKNRLLKGDYAIIANSVNSRIVENLGLNKTRKTIGTGISILGYIMERVECPYPANSWISIAYPSLSSFIDIWMGPMADGTWQVGTTERIPGSPVTIMERFLSTSAYAHWFRKAKIIHKTACFVTPRYPIEEPVVGNIAIIGDAAAPVETWCQGAIACGHQIIHALSEGSPEKYISWWKESFLFNSKEYYKDLARYPALNVFFNDNELNYLFGLIKEEVVTKILDALLKHKERIKAEKPDIYEKLVHIENISLKDIFKD